VLDKYLVIRQHSKSAPVFTLDIADNYPLPNHITVENITGRGTEMGSSTTFSYPQLDQLDLKFLSIPFLKMYWNDILFFIVFLVGLDIVLLPFGGQELYGSKKEVKKTHDFLIYSQSWTECSYKLLVHTKKGDWRSCPSCRVWT